MKKFKTKTGINKTRIILIIIIFLILFILISLYKLKKPYKKITQTLLYNFDNSELLSINFLTSNLDNLFNNYTFYQKELIHNDIRNTIYLYNTHDNEQYHDNKTVYEATNLLKNNLNKLGISVIHEVKKPSELIATGISYYEISRVFLEEIKNQGNIAYYIDIHRDSISNTTVKINNKNYAKILFVLGLDNQNYLKNKAIMLKMNDYLNKNYPGISRGIYEKSGAKVDGVYNQDFSSNVLLMEIGGVDNNIEEVNNSTEIIALMLYHMLGD